MTIDVSNSINESSDIAVSHKKNGDAYMAVPHMHSQYEVYYNVNGAKAFMCDGKVYSCSRRNLIVVPKIYAHKVFIHKDADYERCIISVDEAVIDMISMLCQSDEILSWLTDVNRSNVAVTQLSENEDKIFVSLIDKYSMAQKSGNRLQILACFIKILAFLGKSRYTKMMRLIHLI